MSKIEIEGLNKNFTPLEDSDYMPWGIHQGVMMVDIPAKYMFYLWTKHGLEKKTKVCPVADYIWRNITAFEIDYPDGIWR